ncbi:MAG: DUF4830 domain-containing protein [Clostridia bacterium]|nr:DUF4830 domain-containing protein [Clostridia bacterium]
MFIYSVKATTLKFAAVIGAAVISLAAIILLVPDYTPQTTAAIAQTVSQYNYEKIKTNEDRVAFLKQFGWEVEGEVKEEVTLKIPAEFDKVMKTYNELQKRSGFDLSKYKGREVTRYTYKITNYPEYDGEVLANVIIYKNRVVGGDICSADVEGFIGTFEYPRDKLKDENSTTENESTSEGSESDNVNR